MPGILPMKVIKVGSSAQQSRIAQACDRCRSKKIRCDGLRPCCTQCAQVGFECKTSDKLSRRAFPRGYTESLEERVRALETETRELKELLDAKDEKIDMLSRMHPHSASHPPLPNQTSPTTHFPAGFPEGQNVPGSGYDAFQSFATNSNAGGHRSDICFSGDSSGRGLADALKSKMQDSGRDVSQLNIDTLFHPPSQRALKGQKPSSSPWSKAPPRLFSDQMVNVYFQEWAPLFPLIHRPTFLAMYNEYLANNGELQDKQWMAQINLVFGIAALSSGDRTVGEVQACENQWRANLKPTLMEMSLQNLQCLILAQIFCIQKGDISKLQLYKALAVGIAQKLGLHQSQHNAGAGALVCESKKKVFWCLYTLDCFSAASTGLPRLLNDVNIGCEYPADVDDECVTDEGFQPTLPGEVTKMSSAIALFKASRVLSSVLHELYSNTARQGLSCSKITSLNQELDSWMRGLPSNLRLAFDREKPSTNVISSRCPFLGLTYDYIRMLIHQPVVCSNASGKYPFSSVALASSSKNVVQILQLLEERKMCFSYFINENELLTLCGLGLLFQTLAVRNESKLMKDTKRTAFAAMEMLKKNVAGGYGLFRLLYALTSTNDRNEHSNRQYKTLRSASVSEASPSGDWQARQTLRNIAQRYSLVTGHAEGKGNAHHRTASLDSATTGSHNEIGRRFRRIAPSNGRLMSYPKNPAANHTLRHSTESLPLPPTSSDGDPVLNLDFFSFTGEPDSNEPSPQQGPNYNEQQTTADWGGLLSTLDLDYWDQIGNLQVANGSGNVGQAHVPAEIPQELWDVAGDVFDLKTPEASTLPDQQLPSTRTGSTTSGSLTSGGEDFDKSDSATASKPGSSCESRNSGVDHLQGSIVKQENELLLSSTDELGGAENLPPPMDGSEF